jgi:hypothetical protein
MTESQQLWEAWMQAFSRVRDALPDKVAVPCPSRGDGTVRVSFTADPETRIGYAIAWCDVCLNGIYVSRCAAPPGVDILTFDATDEERDAVIPDVRLLQPDPWLGNAEDEGA